MNAATAPERAPPAGGRQPAYDVAKGIGIILVVIFHVYRGIGEAGRTFPDTVLPFLDYFTYCFHMPLFFVLAGLFVERSLRDGRGPYLRSKLISVYYPYVLWSCITIAISALLSRYVNNPKGFADILTVPLVPKLHFWFLYSLMLYYLIAAFVRDRRALVVIAIAAMLLREVPALQPFPAKELHYFIFFVAGMLGFAPASRGWPLSLLLLIVCAIAGYRYGIDTESVLLVPAAFAGYQVMLALARTLAPGALGGALADLGQKSLAIYLTHLLAAAAVRIVINRALPHASPYVLLATGVMAGIVMPLAAYAVVSRLRLLTLTGLGRDRPRVPPLSSATPAVS